MDEERILKIATALAIIGGVNSVISGGLVALSNLWYLAHALTAKAKQCAWH